MRRGMNASYTPLRHDTLDAVKDILWALLLEHGTALLGSGSV